MRRDHSLVTAAEIALAAVTLSAVLGMSRLFEGSSWLLPLVVNSVAAHITVTICRRRGLALSVTAAVMVAGAACVATWTSYWSTTVLGVPTGETWATMSDDLSAAWTLYQDVIAPAPVETGFVLASAVALWCVAYVADWAAFRLWVPFEATLPAGTLFLFTALLGTPRGRSWAVGIYAASLLGFLLLHRLARQDGTSHWVAERREQGHRSLLTVGAALAALAVVTGVVFGPALPGAGSPGVLDPRSLREGDDSRVTISPLVDIRSRIVNQADVEVFGVRSPEPAYWRLTSLEEFDGRIWSSSGSYSEADGALPTALSAPIASSTFTQAFDIRALSAIWLPSAYEPRTLEAEGVEVLYDEESATLIVDRGIDSSDGISYSVSSAAPRLTRRRAGGRRRRRARRHQRHLPRPARGLQPAGARAGCAAHRRRRHPVRAGPRPARPPPDLRLRPERERRPQLERAGELPVRRAAGLLRAVRRFVRGDGPSDRPARPSRRRLHDRRR